MAEQRWSARPFAGESDLPAVMALRTEISAADPRTPIVSPERLRLAYLTPKPGWWRSVELWEADGQLLGLAETQIAKEIGGDPVAYLRLRTRPTKHATGLRAEMLRSCERVAAGYFATPFQIEISAFDDDPASIALIEAAGYEVDRAFQHMTRDLMTAPERPTAVPGYQLRPLAGYDEVDPWLALYANAFQDHYDFHPIATEERVMRMEESSYLPEFDLVIATDEGELAAFSHTDRREANGVVDWHVDLIGTHRQHRGRGLATWLLLETMDRVMSNGGSALTLEVDATSETGANRLYERLGFVIDRTSIDFRKSFGKPLD